MVQEYDTLTDWPLVTNIFLNYLIINSKIATFLGHLGGSVVERLPLAPSMIPGSCDPVPHQVPCREPDVVLDHRTLGSCSEPKADAQPLSHPGVPRM